MSDKLLASLSSIPKAPETINLHIRAYKSTFNPELVEQAFQLFNMRFKGLYKHPLPIISTLKLMNEFFLCGNEKLMLQVVDTCLPHITEFACMYVPLEEYQYLHKIDDFMTPESFITFSAQLKKYEISLVTLCKQIIQVWFICANKHSDLSAVKQAYKRVPSLSHKKWMYCSQDMPRAFQQNIKAFPQHVSELVKSEMEYLVYARSICRQAKTINLGPKNIAELKKIVEEVEDIYQHSKQYIKRLQQSHYYDKQAVIKSFINQLEFADFFLQVHKLLPHDTTTFKKRLTSYFQIQNAELIKPVTVSCKQKEEKPKINQQQQKQKKQSKKDQSKQREKSVQSKQSYQKINTQSNKEKTEQYLKQKPKSKPQLLEMPKQQQSHSKPKQHQSQLKPQSQLQQKNQQSIQKNNQAHKKQEKKQSLLKKQQIIPKPQQQIFIAPKQSKLKIKQSMAQQATNYNQIERPSSTPVQFLKQKIKAPQKQLSRDERNDQTSNSLLKKRAFQSFASFDSHLQILQKFQQHEQPTIYNDEVSVLKQQGQEKHNKSKKQSRALLQQSELTSPSHKQYKNQSYKSIKKQQLSFLRSIVTDHLPVQAVQVTMQELAYIPSYVQTHVAPSDIHQITPYLKAKHKANQKFKANTKALDAVSTNVVPVGKANFISVKDNKNTFLPKPNLQLNANTGIKVNMKPQLKVQKVKKIQQISSEQLNLEDYSESSKSSQLIEPQFVPKQKIKSKSKSIAVKKEKQKLRLLSNYSTSNTVYPKKAARKLLEFNLTLQLAISPTSLRRTNLINNIAYMITLQSADKINIACQTDTKVLKQATSQCIPPSMCQKSLQTLIVPHSVKVQTDFIKEKIQGCQTSLTINQIKKQEEGIVARACVIKSLEMEVSHLQYKLAAIKAQNQKLEANQSQTQAKLQQLSALKATLEETAQLAKRRSSLHETRIEQLEKHKDQLMRSERAFRSQMDFRRNKFKSRQKSLIFFNAAVNN